MTEQNLEIPDNPTPEQALSIFHKIAESLGLSGPAHDKLRNCTRVIAAAIEAPKAAVARAKLLAEKPT